MGKGSNLHHGMNHIMLTHINLIVSELYKRVHERKLVMDAEVDHFIQMAHHLFEAQVL
ncbi:hypothetical protein D3C85_1453800 [compost metagenome]